MSRARHFDVLAPARSGTLLLCAVALLLCAAPVSARAKPRPVIEEPPLVGQPMAFNGGIGRFNMFARTNASEVRAEDPLLYTLHVSCVEPLGRAPGQARPAPAAGLQETLCDRRPAFARPLRRGPGGYVWEFNYLLRPRGRKSDGIRRSSFSYYKPGVIPAQRYWTTATRCIPLKVTPRGRGIGPTVGGGPLQAPGQFYRITTGAAVLARDDGLAQPSRFVLGMLTLVPPLLALGWFIAWRRLYPDAADRARVRRSRAALQAWQTLKSVKGDDPAIRARQAAKAVDGYLRDRFALTGSAPTPDEMEAHLQDVGLSLAARRCRWPTSFAPCDAACFAPEPSSEDVPRRSVITPGGRIMLVAGVMIGLIWQRRGRQTAGRRRSC